MSFRTLVVGLMALALSACAMSGPRYNEVKSAALNKNQARLFVYRTNNPFGAAIHPSVLLDGQKIGDSRPGGFIMKDIGTGNHALTVTTETEKKYEFTAKAGQQIYVRMAPGLGWMAARIHLEPVSADEAVPEIADLHQQTSFEPYDSTPETFPKDSK